MLTGYSVRRLQQLCAQGSIEGVVFDNGNYLIPSEALEVLFKKEKAKAMPIGLDFVETVNSGYYVDKSLLIRDIIYSHTKTTVFCRPRRFGKSLNLQMLWRFFEEGGNDKGVFDNLDIAHFKEIVELYQGQYPVLYFRFKDLKQDDYPSFLMSLLALLRSELIRNAHFLKDGSTLLHRYEGLQGKEMDSVTLESFLFDITEAIYRDHKKKSIIIIDEYDTPILHAYEKGYYRQAVAFFRNFLSMGMKDNPYLAFAFLSGITPLGKESIFSGFNSAKVNTVLDLDYSSYFGFTDSETKTLLRKFGGYRHYEAAKQAYDGYRFGSTKIFNPWSIANFINSSYRIDGYWRNSADNSFLSKALLHEENRDRLSSLLNGESVQGISFDLHQSISASLSSPSGIWAILLCAGYITLAKDGGFIIPNEEVREAFQLEILPHFGVEDPSSSIRDFVFCLQEGNAEKMEALIKDFLMRSVSNLLAGKEDFYHGFLLGVSFFLAPYFEVKSEMEAGKGRSDLFLSPKMPGCPFIVIEVKQGNSSKIPLSVLAEEALRQIDRQQYDYGHNSSIRFGVAFRGKEMSVLSFVHKAES